MHRFLYLVILRERLVFKIKKISIQLEVCFIYK